MTFAPPINPSNNTNTQVLYMGTSTNYILNEDMQYDSSQVVNLKKWLDTDNVFSTRKNKTIYVLKAVGNWQANSPYLNAQFYGNTGKDSNGFTNTEQWAGFATNDTRNSMLNFQPEALIYGDISNESYNTVGVSGSIVGGFEYNNNGPAGSININANLINHNRRGDLNLNGGFPAYVNGVPVQANTTAQVDLLYSADEMYNWNRLINANISGNVLVNASCDPCDVFGHPIRENNSEEDGNAFTNEAYRHQFAIRGNVNAVNIDVNNPTYLVRIERFGRNISTNAAALNGNIVMTQFTDNFFSKVHGTDNATYYTNGIQRGEGEQSPLISEINLLGNVQNPSPISINGSFYIQSNLVSDANPIPVPGPSGTVAFSDQYEISLNQNSTIADFTRDVISSTQPLFYEDDSFVLVQSNIANATNGSFLIGNVDIGVNSLNLNSKTYLYSNPSQLFEGTISSNVTEVNPYVITMYGSNIRTNNWTQVNAYPNVPSVDGMLDVSWTAGHRVDLYCTKGGLKLDNFILGTTSTPSGNPMIPNFPSYFSNITYNNDNISIDDNTNNGARLVGSFGSPNLLYYQSPKTFTYNGLPLTLDCPVAPEYHIFAFGNSKDTERVDLSLGSVVTNSSSYMADAWQNVLNPRARIVYDNFLNTALSINSPMAKMTPEYTLEFDNWVGKTTVPDGVSFAPNLSINGVNNRFDYNLTSNASILSTILDNNVHLKHLCVNGVLKTEFTLANGVGSKWTDQGSVCGLNSDNFTYKTLLPKYGNSSISGSGDGFSIISDTFLNTLVNYSNYNDTQPDDVHKIVVYDFQYKAYVDNVKRPGTSDLVNEMTFYNNSTTPTPLNANVFVDASYNSQFKGNLSAQPFLTYCYTNMNDASSRESMYPFFNVSDVSGRTAAEVTNDDNYLFPGFIYKKSSNNSAEFYTYRGANDCDFEINTSSNTGDVRNFKLYAVDTQNSTVKIALDGSVAKTIPMRPMKLGRRYVNANTSTMNWYSYVTVYLTNTDGSRDYMVLLFRLSDSPDDNLNSIPNDIINDVKGYLPVTIQVKPVSLWNENKVKFTVSLRAYDSTGTPKSSYNLTSDYSATADLNTFYTPNSSNSVDSSVSINVFSQPLNNLIVTMQYKASTIKSLITYSKQDFDVNNNLIVSSTQSMLYGIPLVNNTAQYVTDSYRLNIPPYTTRFYLDGAGSAVYVDIDNTSQYLIGSTFTVFRSVSYKLYRNMSLVGRGLLSRNPTGSVSIQTEDVITENIATVKAGFSLTFNHNLVDLSARLFFQQDNTVQSQANTREFTLKTLADKLNINVATYRSDTNTYIRVERVIPNVPANAIIYLQTYFGGSLPNIQLSAIRGYPYNLDLVNGNGVGSDSSAVTLNLSNILKAAFRLKITADSYAIFNNNTGVVMNGGFKSIFSTTQHPSTNILGDFTFDFNNISISKQFQSVLLAGINTKIASYTNSGLGNIDYRVDNFSGHYNTQLAEYQLSQNSVNTGPLSKNLYHTVGNSTVYTSSITASGGYYNFNIMVMGQTQNIKFKQMGGQSVLPTSFDQKCTSILYTGTRVIVLHRVKVFKPDHDDNTAPATFDYEELVNSTFSFSNANEVFNGKSNARLVDSNVISDQSYSVVLLNSSNTSQNDFILYRGLKLRVLTLGITSRTLAWFAIYMHSTSFLNGLKLQFKHHNVSEPVEHVVVPVFDEVTTINYEASDYDLVNKTVYNYNVYRVRLGTSTGVELFKLLLRGSLANVPNFKVTIGPAKAHFYEAYDENANNMIDLKPAVSTAFTANFLTELVYNISSAAAATKWSKPRFSVDINNSPNWNQGWIPILGTYVEMKFNKKFSVGYSLDTYFVIKHNNSASFDVLEISTSVTSPTPTGSAPTALTAIQRRRLRTSSSKQWAVSNNIDVGSLSGLTFKLKDNAVVTAGDVVTLFTLNTSNNNNKLQWTVINASNSLTKNISISAYDEERYAAILNNQLKYEQNLEP